jgi:hypothetical protein
LNTDDRPVLSYTTYGASFRSTIAANLTGLLTCRTDASKWVQHPAPPTTMLRHYAASNEAILGHIAVQGGDERDALQHYVIGGKLLPDDLAFRELVITAYMHMSQ